MLQRLHLFGSCPARVLLTTLALILTTLVLKPRTTQFGVPHYALGSTALYACT